MKITFISDTHTKHYQVTNDLPGGDLLIHAGDIMNSGRSRDDIVSFCDWFNQLDNYTHKLFIAGNHDRLFENDPIGSTRLVREYPNINYLEDSLCGIGDVSIYGSPWQPAFYNWAFNLPRNGKELQEKWGQIPNKIDILVCHTMPFGHLDVTGNLNVGCELLRVKTDEIRPKIFVGGHIHSGAGYKFDGHTHFFNASVLNNSYYYKNKPMTIDWDKETNKIEFI
jgi:Icc-related predicted phosphoesterase